MLATRWREQMQANRGACGSNTRSVSCHHEHPQADNSRRPPPRGGKKTRERPFVFLRGRLRGPFNIETKLAAGFTQVEVDALLRT